MRMKSLMGFVAALSCAMFWCFDAGAASWPDGSPIDEWFFDRSPVDEAKLGPLRKAQEFGAKPDAEGLQTEVLQRAIDAIASDGGGVLVLGPGVWNTSSIFFKPKVHLKLEKGAVLKGPEDGGATPRAMTRMVGLSSVKTVNPPPSWGASVKKSVKVPFANVVNGALRHYDWTQLLH